LINKVRGDTKRTCTIGERQQIKGVMKDENKKLVGLGHERLLGNLTQTVSDVCSQKSESGRQTGASECYILPYTRIERIYIN
jgi:hypothetical protein